MNICEVVTRPTPFIEFQFDHGGVNLPIIFAKKFKGKINLKKIVIFNNLIL